MDRSRNRLLVFAGLTGTGKTETAIRVAEILGGEIVGCDALQVYRGFDAATAKPSAEQLERIPHHLIDVADPRCDFSLADYVRQAEAAVAAIVSRGKVPLIVGGTGMYLRGLLRGLVPAPARDAVLRARLNKIAERHGSARLHRLLARYDPQSATRVMPGDTQRIVRGLEIALSGEGTWSEALRSGGSWASSEDRYSTLKIGLDADRDLLAERLNRRVDLFFEAGLIDEVRRLLAEGVPAESNAFKAIGYREVLRVLSEGGDPSCVRDEVQRNTRRFSKRQRTWFRKEPGLRWFDAAEGVEGLAKRTVRLWNDCS